jgi:glyoxylase-like metal-dependent hydrolase (beta-lactamase superfamily II)
VIESGNPLWRLTMHARTVILVLGAICPAACVSAPPPQAHRELAGTIRIADDVHLLAGRFVAGRQPDGNSVIIGIAEGAVVIDSGRHQEHTQKIIDALRDGGLELRAIVNTHWHLDHVAGNALLRRSWPQTQVYASAAIREAMKGFLADYRSQLETLIAKTEDAAAQEQFRTEAARIDSGAALFPTHPVTTSRTPLRIGGRRLELRLAAGAVTAGDVWLFDPPSGVLIAGDLVTLPAPLFDTACPSGWSAALEEIAATPFTLLVPGHGAPMSRAQFESWRRAYSALLTCAGLESRKKDCVDGWLQNAGALIATGDEPLAAGLIDYYIEKHLRGNEGKLASLCSTPAS